MATAQKSKKIEILLALMYVFRFVSKLNPAWDNNGNMDILYLFAIIVFFKKLLCNRKFMKRSVWYVLPFVGIEILTWLFSNERVSLVQGVFWIGKIYLCMILLCLTAQHVNRFDTQKFINVCVLLYGILFVVAQVLRTNLLWRTQENRIEFFYTEPGELSIYCALILLLQVQMILVRKTTRGIINATLLGALLIFCNGMSGILAGALSITVLILGNFVPSVLKRKGIVKKMAALFTILICLSLLIILLTKNPISDRLQLILAGKDSSFGTRSDYNYPLMWSYLTTHYGIGIGFGNMDSVYILSALGVRYVLTAAYPLFFLEGGIFSMIYVVLLNIHLLKITLRQKSIFKLSLLLFINVYLIYGSWLTNPVVWLVIGVIKELRIAEPRQNKQQEKADYDFFNSNYILQ